MWPLATAANRIADLKSDDSDLTQVILKGKGKVLKAYPNATAFYLSGQWSIHDGTGPLSECFSTEETAWNAAAMAIFP